MNTKHTMDPKLKDALKNLRPTPARNTQRAREAREIFLQHAAQLAKDAQPVSVISRHRLNEWKEFINFFPLRKRKDNNMILKILTTVLLISGVLFSGGAGSVYAAQSALPDQKLYPLKTWSEDIRLKLKDDPQDKLNLLVEFSGRRAREIQELFEAEIAIPPSVIHRLEEEQQSSLELAVEMDDTQMSLALEQIRKHTQEQQKQLATLQVRDDLAQRTHQQVQGMLQNQQNLATQGLENPTWLRQQIHLRKHNPTDTSTNKGNPFASGTPTPGSGYGPGSSGNPFASGTPTPGSGYGPGSSGNPFASGTPTPGSGYGPGPGTGTCEGCAPKNNTGNKENGSQMGPNPSPGNPQDGGGKNKP